MSILIKMSCHNIVNVIIAYVTLMFLHSNYKFSFTYITKIKGTFQQITNDNRQIIHPLTKNVLPVWPVIMALQLIQTLHVKLPGGSVESQLVAGVNESALTNTSRIFLENQRQKEERYSCAFN